MNSDNPRALPVWTDLLVVIAAQLAISALIKSTGFTAISDDDYARVVIAQEFVEDPKLDPSGTSWLPFPFLHQGLAMMLFSPSLAFARIWALFSACVAATLLYGAARLWGLNSRWSILGAVTAASVPYAGFLAVATVPEYLTASLIVFAACATNKQTWSKKWSLAAGAGLFLACASRYEAWPVAGAFAGVCAWDARQSHRIPRLMAGLLAVSFPLLWMLHGILHHDSAFFFIKRVVDYKEALGSSAPSAWETAFHYPQALVLAEPEVVFCLCGLLSLGVLGKLHLGAWPNWSRPWMVLLPMLATLVGGAVRGGAPTHHAERALLSVWLLIGLSIVRVLFENRNRWKLALSTTVVYLSLGTGARLAGSFERAPFAHRSAEEHFGKQVASATSSSDEIALALDDYGYFAVMAAAGTPKRFTVLEKHDPREKKNQGDSLQAYKEGGGCLYIVPIRIPPGRDEIRQEEPGKWQLRNSTSCAQPKNSPN